MLSLSRDTRDFQRLQSTLDLRDPEGPMEKVAYIE